MSMPSMAAANSRPFVAWNRTADAICAIALLALWLVCRPYRGVRHDALYYSGQVLARLLTDRLGTDLFFAYGSQDKYSLFSTLVAPLVQRFGIGPTELALLLLCNALFAIACWNLIQSWFPRPVCWAAMMLMAGLPHTYGGLGAFAYSEPFLTARSFAEPLALFALAQLLRGRLALAVVLALLGAAFHPLITLPLLFIGWGVLVQQRRSWAWAALLLAVPFVLALAGVTPFTALLQRFDDAWFSVLKGPNQSVFIEHSNMLDWAPLAFDMLVLALALRVGAVVPVLRQLILAVLAVAVVSTVVWGVGADLAHNVLLTQLQLWRAYWPLHLLGVVLLPTLAATYWQRGWIGRWCVAALGLAAVAVLSNWDTGWLCVVWALLALGAEVGKVQVSRAIALAAITVSVLATLLVSARVLLMTQQTVDRFPDRFGHVVPAMIVVGLPVVVGLLALGCVRLAVLGPGTRACAAVLAAAAVVFGAGVWDQRSAWQLRLEADPTTTRPIFDADVPPEAVVYWDGSLIEPWLLARRANFFDSDQGAGLLFNRSTAIEFGRRARVVAGFRLQRELCATVAALAAGRGEAPGECAISPESVADVCRATPHPDFLVFGTSVALPEIARWQYTPARSNSPGHSFHLYACARLQ